MRKLTYRSMLCGNTCRTLRFKAFRFILLTSLVSILSFDSVLAQGDSCQAALLIGPGTYTANGPSTGGGALQSGAVNADWYMFTTLSSGQVHIYSCDGGIDTRFSVYKGSTCANKVLEGTYDDQCQMFAGASAFASEAYINVTCGDTYYIEWDDRWDTTGFVWHLEGASVKDPLIPLSANDIAITSVSSIFGCGSNDSVEVVISNVGINTQTSVPVLMSVNGGTYGTATTYTGSLAGCASATLTFPATGLTNLQNQTIDVASNLSGDGNHANDSATLVAFNPAPLTGTYTLGGASANFPNFTALVSTLTNCGMSGPTTINVVAGTGPFNERLIFENISGLSLFNSLIINGNGETLQFDAGSQGSDYRLVGFGPNMKHITVNDLVIKELGTSTAFGVHFHNGADSNTVNGCVIDLSNCTSTSTTVVGVAASGSLTSSTTATTDAPSYNIISNNLLLGGASSGAYYGIVLYASTGSYGVGNVISGNIIENVYAYSLYTFYQSALEVTGNDLSSMDRTISTTKYMMYFNGGLNNADISNNYFHDPFGGVPTSTSTFSAIFLNSVDATVGNENNVYNNIIGNINSSGTQYALYNSSSNYANYVHNTVSLDGSGSSTTRGIFLTSTPTNVNMVNNIISTTRAGTSHCVYVASGTTIFSDHNVYWNDTNSTTAYIGYTPSANRNELANMWAVAYDSNSVQEPPVFADPSNHIFIPLSNAIDDIGTPVGLTYDFFFAPRSLTTPDAGAIEFIGLSGDVQLADAEIARQSLCYGTADTVKLTIVNVIGNTINFSNDNLTGSWSVTGPVNSSGTFTVNTGTLGEGQSMTINLTGANLSVPGTYTLSANIDTNGVNAAGINDTLMSWSMETVDTLLTANPNFTVITNPGDSVQLIAASPLIPSGGSNPIFTEICHFKATVPPGGWPSYLLADDYVEISAIPNSDLGGIIYEEWNTTGIAFTWTIPNGTVVGPNGTAVFATGQLSTSVAVPTSFYYHTGNTATHGSSDQKGYILKTSGGDIIDAAAYNNTFTFPAASGVTSSDWSGNTASTTSTNGSRLFGPDINSASNWAVANTGTYYQDPNTMNAGVPVPAPATQPAGFEWKYLGATYDTLAKTYAGPFSTSGDTMLFVAYYNSSCGLYTDTVIVVTDFVQASIVGSTDVSCNGGSDGTATASGSGSVGPYTFLWSNGQTTATATGLSAGTYTVSVYDNDGWPDTASVVISEPTVLGNSFSIVPSGCGAANGSATASPTGGTGSYTYAWSNGSSSAAASSVSSGTYTVTISDANGCTLVDQATVNDAGAPLIGLSVTNVISCNGSTNGQITASVSGGAAPYSYAWAGSSSTTAVASSLGAGTYTLTVTDNLGCAISGNLTISQPAVLVAASTLISNVSCNGGSNGSVSASATGGTTGYTYSWSNGGTSSSITSLPAAAYTVTVTDAHGCTNTSSKTVTQPTLLTASVSTVSNVSCNGGSNGSLLSTPSGGTSGYTYLWSNAQTSATSTGLSASTYTVTVTDANSCTTTASGTVTQPTVMVASISGFNNALCFGSNDGDATAAGSGGTAGYSYLWSSSATSATATGLAAGNYTVTVTDANGCTDTETTTIGQPTLLVSDIVDSSDATCFGYNDGGSEASATGGTSPYSYDWSGSQTGSIVSTLVAGTHTVTVTDDHGCTSTSEVTIGEPTELMNTFTITNLSCKSSGDGVIESNPTGSVPPYSYNWSNGDVNQTADSLSAGTYSLTITDDHGCTLEVSEVVTEPDTLVSAVDSIVDLLCNGDGNGMVMTSTMGGTMPYAYLWSNAADADSIGGLSGGTYTLTVTDTNGCQATISAVVNEPAQLTATLTPTDVSCFGLSDGSITSVVSGGTSPYTYNWAPIGSIASSITGVAAGTYSVSISDANDCSILIDTVINQPDQIDASVTASTVGDGIVLTANATGASYQWIDCSTEAPIDGETNAAYSPTANGSYAVIVTVGDCSDTSDCQNVGNVGVESLNAQNQMKLFPNPTRGAFSIQFNGAYGSDVRFEVLDAQGKLVVSRTMGVITDGQVEAIDTHLSAGVYFVKAYNDDQIMIQRLIVN
ncbi:MAG: T9SS type A sorting domain-containing protein [Flavobacteriales bacterium]